MGDPGDHRCAHRGQRVRRRAAAAEERAGRAAAEGCRLSTVGDAGAERTFRFHFEDRYRRPAKLFGIDEHTATVVLTGHRLIARFGPWLLATPLHNIAHVHLTGPYRFLKTAGPAHLSLTDRGLTFATNSREGVCLSFSRPVPGIDPFGLIRHPNLTVTVADCAGLISVLRSSSTV